MQKENSGISLAKKFWSEGLQGEWRGPVLHVRDPWVRSRDSKGLGWSGPRIARPDIAAELGYCDTYGWLGRRRRRVF